MARRHDSGRQQAMTIIFFAVGALAGETVRTAELLRAEILRPIPGDQGSAAEPTESLTHGRLTQQRLHAFETGLQKRRVGLVQHVANVIVGGDSADAKQRLTVGAALALFQRALLRQKGSAPHEKPRSRRKAETGHLDIAATPLSPTGKSRTNGLQAGKKGGQELHPNPESGFC